MMWRGLQPSQSAYDLFCHDVTVWSLYITSMCNPSLSLCHPHRSGLCSWPANASLLSDSPLARPLPLAQRTSAVLQNLRPALSPQEYDSPLRHNEVTILNRNIDCTTELWNINDEIWIIFKVNNPSPFPVSYALVPLQNAARLSWWNYVED